jgi:hypothetical protein
VGYGGDKEKIQKSPRIKTFYAVGDLTGVSIWGIIKGMMKTKRTRVDEVVLKPSEVANHFGKAFYQVRTLGWWILERIAFQYPDESTRERLGVAIWENNLDLEAGRGFLPYLEEYEKKGIDTPVKVSVPGWETVVVCRVKNKNKKGAR